MAHSGDMAAGSLSRFWFELREGARRQGNVIFALIFREIKSRSGQDGQGLYSLAGIMLEPAFGVAILACFWYLLRRSEIAGVHVALFLAVSYIPFSIVRRSLSSIPRSLRGSRSFYAFQNIKPFDAILARFILELVLMATGSIVLLFMLWWFLDLAINVDMGLHAMGVLMVMIAFSFGLSLFIGVYGTHFPFMFKIIQAFSRGLVLLSAVMHPVSELPVQLQYYIAWNPLAHFLELMRFYLLGIKPFQGVSFGYAAALTITIVFLGFISYYVNRHKVIER
jgi:capsular polysaccharide transport system permease protein